MEENKDSRPEPRFPPSRKQASREQRPGNAAVRKITVDDLINLPRKITDTILSFQNELDYLREHNFFEGFERLGRNTELMLEKITELNENIVKFNQSVQQISDNTRVLGKLEERMSVPGLIIATVKDFFTLLRQIIDVAIFRNLRRLDEMRRGKPLDEIFPRLARKSADEKLPDENGME